MNKIRCVSANQLKAIAIAAMLADHIGWWLLSAYSPGGQLVHFIGRLTAPLMCWFIVQGYIHTSNIKKYLLRLFVFALVSHFPYVIYFGYDWYKATSVIWTLFVGLLAVYMCERRLHNPALKILFILFCCILVYPSDWSYIALLWIIVLYRFRNNFTIQMIWFALVGLILYAVPQFIQSDYRAFFVFGFLMAIPVLYMYSGQHGIKNAFTKWFFYVFYPLHLIILAIFRYLVFS